jgi:hypothetical protein
VFAALRVGRQRPSTCWAEELKTDPQPLEAKDGAAFATFWDYDSLGLFFDLANRNRLEELKDACLLVGFSSEQRSDLVGIRTPAFPSYRQADGQVRAVALRDAASGLRRIEASIPWRYLAGSVETDRMPKAIGTAGSRFGCEPLIADNGWRGQSFVGGSMFGTPKGSDANSTDLELVP